MGKIKVHEFMSLDGVVETPSWTAAYPWTEPMMAAIGSITAGCSDILLGRTTYEMFAPAWSTRTAEEDPGAPFFNDTPKHVVTSRPDGLDWGPATAVEYSPDAVQRVKDQASGDVYVSGSVQLVRAMLADRLVDELHLITYPLALGEGLRLFADGARVELSLLHATPFENGVVHLVYGPA
ncbi:dihydrofolate reductase [Streptomyces sp. NP160]|uniref:dihydrofolate reductase family protein n=1 Tax=Streptomyces sp. NP160 TaxID=2586637 RepID=UPI00111803E2|nr:dihydrofolate reductase family protein [Streptomyces sp. NP160]TNM69604.1 dihydrofolate reductase [Streptomyces sp. NP160]